MPIGVSTLGAFVRRSGYLRKWLILGIAIGVIAALGAVAFYLALDHAGKFPLGFLGGYDVPTAAGDGGRHASAGFERPWAIPLVSSVAQAPLALIIMVAEMTSSFSVLPGAMIAVGVAYPLIEGTDVSIYTSQRLNRDAVEP